MQHHTVPHYTAPHHAMPCNTTPYRTVPYRTSYRYGLTEKEAGNVAYAFSVYDSNEDGKLDLRELGKLW